MQGAYGGLIIIVIYATEEGRPLSEFFLITDDNNEIFTDSSDRILGDM